MTAASLEPERATAAAPSLLDRFDALAAILAGVVLAIRPLAAGQTPFEPETAFLQALVWLAAMVLMIHRAWAGKRLFPRCRLWPWFAIFALFAGLSVWRAWGDGNAQKALDLARVWAGDLVLCALVADLGRDPRRRRLFAACLLAGLAAVVVFTFYQRLYGLEYFRQVMEFDRAGALMTAGGDEQHRLDFASRVGSTRASGPYGYSNALASYLLLLLPFLGWRWSRSAGTRPMGWRGWLFCGGVFCLVFSGSKAGILAAKGVEWAGLLLLASHGRRRWKTGAWLLGGIALASMSAAGAALAVKFAAGTVCSPNLSWLAAETVFALAWCAEILWLYRHVSHQDKPLPRWVPRMGGASVAAVIALGGLLVFSPQTFPGGTTRDTIRRRALETLFVRAGYWQAALRMAADHPLRGVGLDNFGSRYTQYKSAWAWPVKKVHNHYLQLAADGGVPLLLAFLLLMGALLRPAFRFAVSQDIRDADRIDGDDRKTAREKKNPAAASMAGSWRFVAILSASLFGFLYWMRLQGVFGGLSVEFFLNELFGTVTSGSIRARTGAGLPMAVHGLVHFLALPLAWGGVFLLAAKEDEDESFWKMENGSAMSAESLWWALGVAGALLHGFCDFTPEIASISALLWAVAGMTLAAEPGQTDEAPVRASGQQWPVLAAAVAGGALVWSLGLGQVHEAWAIREAELSRDTLLMASERPDDAAWKDALAAVEAAQAKRPRDAALWRMRAQLFQAWLEADLVRNMGGGFPRNLALRNSEEIVAIQTAFLKMMPRWPALEQRRYDVMDAWDRVCQCDPYYAPAYAHAAETRMRLFPVEQDEKRKAVEEMETARALHPWRASYPLRLAMLLRLSGQPHSAYKPLTDALALDQAIPHPWGRLSESERRQAELLKQQLDRDVSY